MTTFEQPTPEDLRRVYHRALAAEARVAALEALVEEVVGLIEMYDDIPMAFKEWVTEANVVVAAQETQSDV